MLPLLSFKIDAVKAILEEFGIYVLEEFPDGQIRWGNVPPSNPYRGLSHMADFYRNDRYDIFTIRSIANKLDKVGELPKIEKMLQDAAARETYSVSNENGEFLPGQQKPH